jgi:hypothetical protein
MYQRAPYLSRFYNDSYSDVLDISIYPLDIGLFVSELMEDVSVFEIVGYLWSNEWLSIVGMILPIAILSVALNYRMLKLKERGKFKYFK